MLSSFLLLLSLEKVFLRKKKYRIYNAVLFDAKFMLYDMAEIPRKVVSVMNDEKKRFPHHVVIF